MQLIIKKILINKKLIIKIIVLALIFLIATFPLDFYIYMPGGIEDTVDKVSVEEAYDQVGSFNLAYVSEGKANVTSALLSFAFKNWDRIPKADVTQNNESYEDSLTRSKLLLNEANENATIAAFDALDVSYIITGRSFNIVFVTPDSESDFEIGDQILKLNDTKITSVEQYTEILNTLEIGETVNVDVINKASEEVVRTAIIYEDTDYHKVTGIFVVPLKDISTKTNIDFHFEENESGPSGGLMMALTIYNKLEQEDITNGKKIVGTGTISETGIVGEIDGIKYKLKSAVKGKADIFLSPKENYEEAMGIKKENKYDIEIISIETFSGALEYLSGL